MGTPSRRLVRTVKAVVTTLASKMAIVKNAAGEPVWTVSVMLNDGSASMKADIGPGILRGHIGSAADYLALGRDDPAAKAAVKERMKVFSQWLATVSGLVKIRVEQTYSLPVVEEITEVGGQQLALMRRRRLQQ